MMESNCVLSNGTYLRAFTNESNNTNAYFMIQKFDL